MADFTGKTVAISGAAGGIGQEVAQLMHHHGAQVVLGDLDGASLDRLAARLDPAGDRVLPVVLDAASATSNDQFVAAAVQRFGHLDHLVVGAGIYVDQPLATMSDEQWRTTMSVNLDGAMYLTRAAIPALRAGGSIVTLTSLAGHRGSKGHSHYAATKGALVSFTRSMAWELGPDIRANAVSPGVIETPMTTGLIDGQGQHVLASTPLARFGQASEVASVVEFLCSPAASFVNGEVIHVNGGLHMA